MMIDWVSRSAGDAAADTFQAVRCLLECSESSAADSVLPELAAVVFPIG